MTLDFENTGSLSFTAAPGVEVFSASGVFPDTMLIPEPSTALLLVFGSVAFVKRRRRRVG